MQPSFTQIVERARRGDAAAASDLIAPHLARLTAFVRLRSGVALRRRESCSDLVQSICRVALLGLDRVEAETEDGFRRWLYAVAVNQLVNKSAFHRRARRDPRRDDPAFEVALGDEALLRSYADLCTPSRRAMAREEVARIESAFDRLSSDHREVLTLRFLAGLSHAEMAERLERSEEAVRSLLVRARARLAILVDE